MTYKLIVKVCEFALLFCVLWSACYLYSKNTTSCFGENTHILGNLYNHSIIGNLKCITRTCLPEMCSLINTKNVKSLTIERDEMPNNINNIENIIWIFTLIMLSMMIVIKIYQIAIIVFKNYQKNKEISYGLTNELLIINEELLNIED